MKVSTPTKSPKSPKSPKPVEDVEEEFCKRTMQLLTAFYEPIGINEILMFPPVQENEQLPQEKSLPFNSSVVELRLKRTVENEINNYQQLIDNYNKRIAYLQNEISSQQMNLDEIFQAEPIDRPAKPLYIVNEEKDIEAAERMKLRGMKTLDVLKTEPQMKERLQEAQKKGKERAAARVLRMSNIDVNKLQPSPRKETLPPKPKKYEPEGGYPVMRNRNSKLSEKKKDVYYKTDE